MSFFKFSLRQTLIISTSGETGEVLARAEYATGENSYYLRYKAADGRATEAWWAESALTE
jgi:hypothetical protein